MKKILSLVILVGFPVVAFGQDGVALPPEWLASILDFIQGVPYLGPIVVQLMQWIGLIAAVMTSVSVFVQGLLVMPEVIARFSGAQGLADKIKAFSDKIMPWLKYFSIFNVQKKLPENK